MGLSKAKSPLKIEDVIEIICNQAAEDAKKAPSTKTVKPTPDEEIVTWNNY